MALLKLPAELTIYTAADLRAEWLAWAATVDAPQATADAGAVDQVDGAGVQLLVALQRSLAARGPGLRVTGSSPALRNACAALGLADWLNRLQTAQAVEAA